MNPGRMRAFPLSHDAFWFLFLVASYFRRLVATP
jgi:hypothetical protein